VTSATDDDDSSPTLPAWLRKWVFCGIGAFVGWGGAAVISRLWLKADDIGTWGDSFAPLTGIASTLALVFAVWSVNMQRKELALQRDELRLTREEMEAQRQEMEAQRRAQQESARLQHVSAKIDRISAPTRIEELQASIADAAVSIIDEQRGRIGFKDHRSSRIVWMTARDEYFESNVVGGALIPIGQIEQVVVLLRRSARLKQLASELGGAWNDGEA
jgi:hypothetical protein